MYRKYNQCLCKELSRSCGLRSRCAAKLNCGIGKVAMAIKILLMGADWDCLDEIEESLQIQNFTTIKIQEIKLGLQIMQDEQPSLVVCEQKLLETSYSALFSEYPEVPLLVIVEPTEYQAESMLETVNYLIKPFTKTSLLEAVHHCLQLEQQVKTKLEYVQSLEQQISHYQELTDLYRLLLEKFSEEVCHPISNISLILQLLGENSGELTKEDRGILEDECARAISLLDQIATFQELLQSSKLAILRQLLVCDRG
jgi:signal transduction histidine kinase